MAQETIERRFSVTVPACLRLSNIRGSVDILPGDDDAITVTAVKDLDSGDPERTEIEITQREDGSVRVKTRARKQKWWFFNWSRPCKVDYTVRVPRNCSVKVRCVSSSASLQGLEGEFEIGTVSGPILVQDLTGNIELGTVSGTVGGERLSGPADIDTVSGKVRLTESNLPSLKVSSVSAPLVLQTSLGEGPYRFKTVSGDVQLVVPPETGCTVGSSSVSGRLETSLPATRTWRQGGRRGAELQGGGPEVRFSSVSANLRVVREEGEPAQAPAAKPLSEARREILDRVARGEISAEEGVAELDKL